MEVKSIELVFENCEGLEIPKNRLGTVLIDNIGTHIKRVACNYISKSTSADLVFLEIFNCKSKDKALNRITQWNDITQIIMHYEDDSEETYFVDYVEPDGQENTVGAPNINQTTIVSTLGNIYILISFFIFFYMVIS